MVTKAHFVSLLFALFSFYHTFFLLSHLFAAGLLINTRYRLTPIKQSDKENVGDHGYSLKCDTLMINRSNSTLEQNIKSVISEQTDSGSQNNYVKKNSKSQLVNVHEKTTNRSQTLKIGNRSKDVSFRQEQRKEKCHILSCVAGSCIGLAIAYFAGAAALTPIDVAIGAFIGMALAGAFISYGITKLCKKVKTKIENPCAKQHIVQELEV